MNEDEIKQLIKQKNFPDKPEKVELRETHISWVLLAGEKAFKIKKPVKFSFLDFSTHGKRKEMLEKELKLNKRMEKRMYEQVVEVREDGKKLFIGKENGKIIDYALQMKRLDEAKKMDVLLKEKKVSVEEIERIAVKISSFHKTIKNINTDNDVNTFLGIFNDIGSVKDIIAKNLGKEATEIIDFSTSVSNRFLHEHSRLFKERASQGLIKDCHGDIHSGNIFLYEKEDKYGVKSPSPVIFDCIEFNDAFRQIDVLNDIAFFCMDLESFKRQDLSDVFLKTYLERFSVMQTDEEKKMFIYFKLYRANVRVKVNAFQLEGLDGVKRTAKLTEIKKYLNLMNKYSKQI